MASRPAGKRGREVDLMAASGSKKGLWIAIAIAVIVVVIVVIALAVGGGGGGSGY